ncbi:hypothetical protein ACP4OV_025756 [Aristida adscensionis]
MCRGSEEPRTPDAGRSHGGGGATPSPSASPSPPQSPGTALTQEPTPDEIPQDPSASNGNTRGDSGEVDDNKKPIMALIDEVDQGNAIIMQKIMLLNEKYQCFRPIDRDGNCFYRAFIFSYLEQVLAIKDDSERNNEVTRLRHCVFYAKEAYDSASIWMTKTSFLAGFDALEYVFDLIEAGISPEQLYWLDIYDGIISKSKLLTEFEVCMREEFYYPFVSTAEEYESVHEFCWHEVRPNGKEANHVQIMALVNALGIPLILENLDTSLNHGVIQLHQVLFCPREEFEAARTAEEMSAVECRKIVTLLYRPGHYDILYPK